MNPPRTVGPAPELRRHRPTQVTPNHHDRNTTPSETHTPTKKAHQSPPTPSDTIGSHPTYPEARPTQHTPRRTGTVNGPSGCNMFMTGGPRKRKTNIHQEATCSCREGTKNERNIFIGKKHVHAGRAPKTKEKYSSGCLFGRRGIFQKSQDPGDLSTYWGACVANGLRV